MLRNVRFIHLHLKLNFFYSTIISKPLLSKILKLLWRKNFLFPITFNHIVKTVFETLGFPIRNPLSFYDIVALKFLFHSSVRSKLEYSSIIWYPLYGIRIDLVKSVQRSALKFLLHHIDGYYLLRGYNHNLLSERFNFGPLHTRKVLATVTLV